MKSGFEKLTKIHLDGNYYTDLAQTTVYYRYSGISDSYQSLPNEKPKSIKILADSLAYVPETQILYCEQFVCLTNYSFDNFRILYGDLSRPIYITNDVQVFFYSEWNTQKKYTVIPGLNPQNFSIINEFYNYATDGETIFFRGNPISNADVNTFQPLGNYHFSYDNNTVFFNGQPSNINPSGFISINGLYFKNNQSIYCLDTFTPQYVELKAKVNNFKEYPEYGNIYGDGQNFYKDCTLTQLQRL